MPLQYFVGNAVKEGFNPVIVNQDEQMYLVHATNCIGHWTVGFARGLRRYHPEVYTQYVTYCKSIEKPVELLGTYQTIPIKANKHVINLFSSLGNRKVNKSESIRYVGSGISSFCKYMGRYKSKHIVISSTFGMDLLDNDWLAMESLINTHLPANTTWRVYSLDK
jgi:hypothetical protein